MNANQIFHLLTLSLLFFSSAFGAKSQAKIDGAIIGGSLSLILHPPGAQQYAAWVLEDGTINPISFSSESGVIHSCKMNQSGLGLLGGYEKVSINHNLFSTFVEGDGTLHSFIPSGQSGTILSVALNNSGMGLIGGYKESFKFYAAGVSFSKSQGVTFDQLPVPDDQGAIFSTTIDEKGRGVLGGSANSLPYLAKMNADKSLTTVQLTSEVGEIFSVSMNQSGKILIGGKENLNAYAATLFFDETSAPQSLIPSASNGQVNVVAISSSGKGLIAGEQNSMPYAATISEDNQLTSLPLSETVQKIYSVDINASGNGVIGGQGTSSLYGALISSSGEVQEINTFSERTYSTGFISSVAINDSGSAVIGGNINDQGYCALVAPDGTVIEIISPDFFHPGGLYILSVDVVNFANHIDPKSFGIGNSFATPLFHLSNGVMRGRLEHQKLQQEGAKEPLSFVASSRDKLYGASATSDTALWLSPFGIKAREEKNGLFPSQEESVIGAALGAEYALNPNTLLGGAIAYAYQDIRLGDASGRARVNQELATIYGEWKGEKVTLEGALSGGIYQLRNDRKTLGVVSSNSLVHGTLLSPHLGVKKPISFGAFTLSPFLSFDWVNNWQGKIHEEGKSNLNLRISPQYVSLLRSEVGLLFAQSMRMKSALLYLEEGVSYVRKTPFHVREVSATYVSSNSSFKVGLFNPYQYNLGSFQIKGTLLPFQAKGLECSLEYQGEWGKKSSSNLLSLELKKRF